MHVSPIYNKLTMKNSILIFILCFTTNIWAQDEPIPVKNQDTVYVYYDYSSDRMSKTTIPVNEINESVIVTLKYPIRPFSYWKNLKESKEKGNLQGDTRRAFFSLKYLIEYNDKNRQSKLTDVIPKEFIVLNRTQFRKLDIIDWNIINTDEELKSNIDKMKKASVVYVVDKVNTYNYILHKTRFTSHYF